MSRRGHEAVEGAALDPGAGPLPLCSQNRTSRIGSRMGEDHLSKAGSGAAGQNGILPVPGDVPQVRIGMTGGKKERWADGQPLCSTCSRW
jgi:hypothetical protein